MEALYRYVGFLVIVMSGVLTTLYAFYLFIFWATDFLAKRYRPMLWILEYIYRRKDFKQYMQDKKHKLGDR